MEKLNNSTYFYKNSFIEKFEKTYKKSLLSLSRSAKG